MRKLFVAALCCLTLSLKAQVYKPYEFPQQLPEKYNFQFDEVYKEVLKSKYAKLKDRDLKRYAEIVAYQKINMFTSGSIYLNIDEAENYINKLYQKILPDSLKDNPAFKAYIIRSSEHNAFTINDGSIYLNAGIIADVNNEAALAIIMGHELAHFLNHDSQRSFARNLNLHKRKNRNNNDEMRIDAASYSRQQEMSADSIGYILADIAGYEVYNGLGNFYLFENDDKFESDNSASARNTGFRNVDGGEEGEDDDVKAAKLLADHPENVDRIEQLVILMGRTKKNKSKKDYLISETEFAYTKNLMQHECIYLLLKGNAYETCITKCFQYHLLNPNDNFYLMNLLEGIRRQCYIKPSFGNNSFISYKASKKKFKTGQGILHNINFLIRDSVQQKQIKATELVDTSKIEFETYTESFNYFAEIAKKKNLNEVYLMLALFNYKSPLDRIDYLNEYLEKPNIERANYAKVLKDNKLNDALQKNTTELLLVDDVYFLEDHYYGYHERFAASESKTPEYINEVEALVNKKFKYKTIVPIYKLKRENIQLLTNYYETIVTSTYSKNKYNINQGYNKKLVDPYVLNPDLWEFYSSNNIKSLEYIKIKSFDDKTQIARNAVTFINPCFYFGLLFNICSAISEGSKRYAYEVDYYAYDVKSNQPYQETSEVHYKMTKPHFLNTMYYTLKHKEKNILKPQEDEE